MSGRDIVEQLRDGAYSDGLDDKLMKAAADEIERLRREIKVLLQLDGFREKQVIDHGTRHP